MTTETASALARIQAALAEHREGDLPVDELAQALRGEKALLAALPPRYGQVLEDVLGRLESASLFVEESCSFSQRDLLEALDEWVVKAGQAGVAAKTG